MGSIDAPPLCSRYEAYIKRQPIEDLHLAYSQAIGSLHTMCMYMQPIGSLHAAHTCRPPIGRLQFICRRFIANIQHIDSRKEAVIYAKCSP